MELTQKDNSSHLQLFNNLATELYLTVSELCVDTSTLIVDIDLSKIREQC